MGKQMVPGQFPSLEIRNLDGGWNPRQTPQILIKGGDYKDKARAMQSPALMDCEFNYPGGINKRKGKARQGLRVAAATTISQALKNLITSESAGVNAAICGKFTPASTFTLGTVQAEIGIDYNTTNFTVRAVIKADSAGSPGATISSGASSNLVTIPISSTVPAPVLFTWPAPPTLVSGTAYWLCIETNLGSGAVAVNALYANYSNLASTNIKKNNTGYSGAYTSVVGDLFYLMTAATPAIQGIFDYKNQVNSQNIMAVSNGGVYYANAVPPISTTAWTPIKTGLSSTPTDLTSFVNHSGLCFMTDNAGSIKFPQVWDGISTGTMDAGYRLSAGYRYPSGANAPFGGTITAVGGRQLTMAGGISASGLYIGKTIYLTGGATARWEVGVISNFGVTAGNVDYIVLLDLPQQDRTTIYWNACSITISATGGSVALGNAVGTNGQCFKLIPVTKLRSGGYRAGEEISVTYYGATSSVGSIALGATSALKMNNTSDGTEFAFDVDSSATTWFMTQGFDPTYKGGGASASWLSSAGTPDSQVYYKLSPLDLSVQVNPTDNNTTAFNIISRTAGQNTLLQEFTLEQAYFTAQIDMPQVKYLEEWQGFLVAAGDSRDNSRLNISALYSPQIWSEFGGLDGTYTPVPANKGDGQAIIGIKSHNGDLYVLKTLSGYRMIFTGSAIEPFRVEKLAGEALGCLSHWSIREIPGELVFLSNKGPAAASGGSMAILKVTEEIQNLFQAADSNSYNLTAMLYATSLVYHQKNQVWWGVASHSSDNRDQVLVYDYQRKVFYPFSVYANYLQVVTDANGFPQPWSGDYSGQVFLHDTTYYDDGSVPVALRFSTPWLNESELGGWNLGQWLSVSGVPSTGTLYIEEYVNFATSPSYTYTISMTDANIRSGLRKHISSRYQYHRFVFTHTDAYDCTLESLKSEFLPLGMQ